MRRGLLLCSFILCVVIVISFAAFGYGTEHSAAEISVTRLGRFDLKVGSIIKSELNWASANDVTVMFTTENYSDKELLSVLKDRPKEFTKPINEWRLNTVSSKISPFETEQTVTVGGLYYIYVIQAETDPTKAAQGIITQISGYDGFTTLWLSSEDYAPLDPFELTLKEENGRWMTGSGIYGSSRQHQLENEMSFIEERYAEEGENFVITEYLPAAQSSDTERINYLYDSSEVFRKMSELGGGMDVSPFGNTAALEPDTVHQTTFMVDDGSFRIDMDYYFETTQMEVQLVDPAGKTVYTSGFNSAYKGGQIINGENGLWRIVRSFETGAASISVTSWNSSIRLE